ncbi:aldo/keto reductase [Kribbella solani]|uniref:aldo/keto reductase n=1 Tax=Kribbella solani TaxID=236067 RepID=UPI0029AB1BA2|nr:aldo/keto reductase [Kribbella solani]MDX3003297.1 aldo/keto reductase [Kribbella solani]
MAAPSQVLAARSTHDLRLPRFGLGGSHLGQPPGADGDAGAIATVDAAYQAGIRFFETSPAYGEAERRLGTALGRRPRAELLIATRLPATRLMATRLPATTDLESAIRESSERLGLTADLVLLQHDSGWGVEEVRRAGVVGRVGVVSGDWRVLDEVVRGAEPDCVLLTGGYSLLDQSAGPLLERCRERRVPVIVSGVLTPQVLQAEKSSEPDGVRARRIAAVCERYGVSLPQAALAFPGRHPAVASVLIAASTPAEIRADAALVRQAVPQKLWQDQELIRLLSQPDH